MKAEAVFTGAVNVVWAGWWDEAEGMPGLGAYDGGTARTREELVRLLRECIDYHRAAGHPGRAYLTDAEGRLLRGPGVRP